MTTASTPSHQTPLSRGSLRFPLFAAAVIAANALLAGTWPSFAHVLIHLFSPMAAVVVTALSAYGFLFMLAEDRATHTGVVPAALRCPPCPS